MPKNEVVALAIRHQLERRALAAFLKARDRRAEADKLEAEAARLRAKAQSPLRIVKPRSPGRGASLSAARTIHHWPFSAALQAQGSFPAEWAERQRRPPVATEVVRAWLKGKGKGGRRVPQFWAERIAAEFKDDRGHSIVPALDSSWPCGVKWTSPDKKRTSV